MERKVESGIIWVPPMQFDILSHIVLVLLLVTGILVLFARIGLPSVLGYLTAGILAGPDALGILSSEKEMGALSEVGIILMMFMIGLDFSWSRLRRNLKMVIGVGSLCTAVVTAVTMLLLVKIGGLSLSASFLIGGAVAMSSTAVVSKQLMDQREFYESHGKIAFGITLFQDFAAIIFLALIPALAHAEDPQALIKSLAFTIGTVFAVLIGIYWGGRKIERSLMRFIGALKSNEIFVLTTLLTIMGAAWISSLFHLPTVIGVFLAGMIIGETEFRHKVEDDMRPFHDIMIGIFFIVMGLTLKLPDIPAHFLLIMGLLAGIIGLKLVLTTLIVSLYSKNFGNGLRVGLVLSNCDEFSLILMILGMKAGIIDSGLGNILLIALILSLMFSTLLILYNKTVTFFFLSLLGLDGARAEQAEETDELKDLSNHIILCGFGETGKNIRNILKMTGIPIAAIDTDPQNVENAMALDCRAMYGDATSLKTLKSAAIDKAKALIITFDNYAQTLKMLHKIRSEYPTLPIIVRVHRVSHIEDILLFGATAVFSDGLGISLSMRQEIMKALKVPEGLLQDEEEIIKEAFKS